MAYLTPSVNASHASALKVSVLPSRPSPVARLLATEVLLADPESLGDDVLESCLYILRDKLRDVDGKAR